MKKETVKPSNDELDENKEANITELEKTEPMSNVLNSIKESIKRKSDDVLTSSNITVKHTGKLTKKNNNDACYDLHCIENITIKPNEICLVPTGVQLELPNNIAATVRPRSGLMSKGILVGIGTIDPDYIGEIKVVVTNTTKYPIGFQKDDRIAQLYFHEVLNIALEEVKEITKKTTRADNGFGSTGLK